MQDRGFSRVSGVDPSPRLVERGRSARSDLCLEVLPAPPVLPHASASVDVVLPFAVLTCVPDDAAQRALVAEPVRFLAPGGLLYVNDLLLRDDERNRDRYRAHARRFGTPYGVFTTDDGRSRPGGRAPDRRPHPARPPHAGRTAAHPQAVSLTAPPSPATGPPSPAVRPPNRRSGARPARRRPPPPRPP
ncbi:MAG: methyltransferase domain-containing protein [Streptomyces sp.]|nr:methyltransferase domain-containing protein [Streptomyces sp.]